MINKFIVYIPSMKFSTKLLTASFVIRDSFTGADDTEDVDVVTIVSIIDVSPTTLSTVIFGILDAADRTEDTTLLDNSIFSVVRVCFAANSNANVVESTTINTISGVVA